jgi:hypothetical protein
MAIDFPNSPVEGQIYSAGARSWTYSSGAWILTVTTSSVNEITPIDDMRYQFDGIDSTFVPRYNGEFVTILNPLRILLTLNGTIQTVNFPEYVWGSPLSRDGFMVDSDGNFAFSEPPPAGSTFDGRVMAGTDDNSKTKVYPFRAVDILLGA